MKMRTVVASYTVQDKIREAMDETRKLIGGASIMTIESDLVKMTDCMKHLVAAYVVMKDCYASISEPDPETPPL